MTVWKFQLAVADEQIVAMPEDARVLTVQAQAGVPCLWAVVDPARPPAPRRFVTHGTGHRMLTDGDLYVGSYQLHGGAFVGHVFEVPA